MCTRVLLTGKRSSSANDFSKSFSSWRKDQETVARFLLDSPNTIEEGVRKEEYDM